VFSFVLNLTGLGLTIINFLKNNFIITII